MERVLFALSFILAISVAPASAVVGGVTLDTQHQQILKPVLRLTVNQLPCTGTLVDGVKILTAGHCLIFADLDEQQPRICMGDDAGADLGCLGTNDYDVSMPTAVHIQPVPVGDKMYLIHDPDLVMINVKPNATAYSKLRSLPSASIAVTDDSSIRNDLMIVGQGCSDYANAARDGQLRYGVVNLDVSHVDGLHFFSTYRQGSPGASACTGDSGGPLLEIGANHAPILYGVTSQEGVFSESGPTLSVFASLFSAPVKQWLANESSSTRLTSM